MNYNTIPTEVGATKLRNASLLGKKISITRVAFGDGDGSEYTPTGLESNLKKQVYECPPTRIAEEGENQSWIEIEAVIPHNVGGWHLREVGCFDDDGDLIFIGNLPPSFKPSGEAGVIKDLVFEMIYDAVAADVVQIKIDPNVVIATRKYVDEQCDLRISKASISDSVESESQGDVASSKAAFDAARQFGERKSAGIISFHPKAINKSVTIPSNVNAEVIGPEITIEKGVTLTISKNSTLTVR